MDLTKLQRWQLAVTVMGVSVGCGPGGFGPLEAGGETGDAGDGDAGDGDGDAGDGDGDNSIPLALVSGRTDETGAFVLLRFSEPIAPPDGVDPTDFRLSLGSSTAFYYQGDLEWAFSSYYDPGYYDQPAMKLAAVSIGPGEMPTDLVLRFESPLVSYVCEYIAEVNVELEMANPMPEFEGRIGLYPHYSPGATPVRSADGEALQPIGPEWVELDFYSMYSDVFGFPKLSPQIPLDCIVDP
jgi:hypothetical protein